MSKPKILPEKIVWSEMTSMQKIELFRWARDECADLGGADLVGANLDGADLRGADLGGAENTEYAAATTSILPDGDIVGWKMCYGGVIVKLLVPAAARRSNDTGRKCRAEFARVLEVIGGEVGISKYDSAIKYRAGGVVKSDSWDENRWEGCSHGIHFFITRYEAEHYSG